MGVVRVGPANAAGAYLGDPEASGRSFRDGWFLTGDAGRFDAAGCLVLAGRLDDRINFGGIKIYPAEIEDVLRSFAGIADAAVAGMPSPRYQEVPVAAVVSEGPVDYPALFAHCRARLAADRMPRTVLRVDALPRTGSGKVDHPALRRLLAARLARKSA
ncbi:class I adenylate-forming enzyme family protein [Zoogloea sp.]|uniref:class I adenylate-forming enzyme family protein n=1 Tax=Zoogloea sp. TaxID=49181 RepID=UPI0035AEB653